MKLLLLCLGLTLVCAHPEENHDVVTSNFDLSKISGEYYSILVASDVKEKIEEEGTLRIFLENTQVLDDSSMLFKYHTKINGECAEGTFLFDETEEKGVYRVAHDGYNQVKIVEADYSDYFIVYVLNFDTEKITQLMALHARTPDVSPELKKRFEELSQNHGIPKENVLDLTNTDRCFQARATYRG